MHGHVAKNLDKPQSPALCTVCGIPLDSEFFDESGVIETQEASQQEVLTPGQEVVLARFELPPQYCGVLEYFSQFTDLHAGEPAQIRTPDIQWRLLVNHRPLYPYLALDRIVNPWGYGSFPISIRLDENATLEFTARRVSEGNTRHIKRIGGRIVGRYWYNALYGDVV